MIVVLIKDPQAEGPATLHYGQVGDFTTAHEKVAEVVAAGSMLGLPSNHIAPNAHGDWLNQRRDDFTHYIAVASKDSTASTVFGLLGTGVASNRAAWVYSSSRESLRQAIHKTIEAYDESASLVSTGQARVNDPGRISWSSSLEAALKRGQASPPIDHGSIRTAMFRPFARQFLYLSEFWNHRTSKILTQFPTAQTTNLGLVFTSVSSHDPFSVIMVDAVPDGHALDSSQFLSRWRYEEANAHGALFDAGQGEIFDGYRRIDNVTDEALERFQAAYGESFTKDDIFFYVYGLLHSPEYREIYGADLKKMLPRIPLVKDAKPFVDAGRRLSELHLGYESVTPYPLAGLDVEALADDEAYDLFRVEKMTFAKKRDTETKKLVADKSTVIYNDRITLSGIPEDAHRYMLGPRSAVEWIIDRYRVKTDKPSGIVNDPNEWSREVEDPRYIIDLLARIVTVSLETMSIVDSLPALDVRERQD